jgi:multimeric flavodoxin WrbA
MKKIVVLNGSPRKAGSTAALAGELLKAAQLSGADIKDFNLNLMNIRGCQSCYACKKTGECVVKDDMQQIYQAIDEADGVIFATPVYMLQMTAQMKLAIDRLYRYFKEDFTNSLAPGKKAVFAVTQGNGDIASFRNYFEMTSNSLKMLGFADSRLLIAGGLRDPKQLLENKEALQQAAEIGEWLLD